MSDKEKESLICSAKGLSKYFELNVTLKIFGRVVWSWTFPPKSYNHA